MATAVGRGHAGDTVADRSSRHEHEIDAGGHRARAAAKLERTKARLRRDQACRARRVVRRARALHAKAVRDAARGDGEVAAGGGEDALTGRRRTKDLLEVERLDANEDARAIAIEIALLQARLSERLIAALEEKTLLRVHCRRLRRRDGEESCVEHLSLADKAAVAHSVDNTL